MPDSVKVLAPAKLNLALSVGPPNDAGMHPICSWMVTVDLADELHLTKLDPGRLSRYAVYWHKDAKRRSEINWSITKDLAVRAHLALERKADRILPVQMKLEKRIPVGGGLGGGSSNAAAMLRAVNEMFELGFSLEQLAEIGASIGSDVPFLVKGGSALVEGVGDRLTHHEPPSVHAVLVFPQAACPTAQVYRLFDELSPATHTLRTHQVQLAVDEARHKPVHATTLFNDLTAAAIQSAPELQENLNAVSDLAERQAYVSGSGSTLFVLCDNEAHAEALAASVERMLNLPAVAVQSTDIHAHAR